MKFFNPKFFNAKKMCLHQSRVRVKVRVKGKVIIKRSKILSILTKREIFIANIW